MQNRKREGGKALISGLSPNVKVVYTIDLTHVDEEMDKNITPECSVRLTCVVCKKTFSDSIELHKHATLVHSDVKIFFCDLCTESFLREKDMQEHKKMIHHVEDENNDYLLIPQKEIQKQNLWRHTEVTVKKSLNVNQIRGRRRRTYLKPYVVMNRIQVKTRSKEKSSNSLKSILAKHGCLKEVTIPLIRIDNHPFIRQKIKNNKESNTSKMIEKETSKTDEEEDVFLVKVKKCKNKGNIFSISRLDQQVNVKDTSQKSHSAIDTSVLKELIRKLEAKDFTSTVEKIDFNEDGTCSEIKTHFRPTTDNKEEKLKGFRKADKVFSETRRQNIQKNINILQKETVQKKRKDSEMLETQNRKKQNANTLKNVGPSKGNVSHAQHPIDAAQNCSTVKQKTNTTKSFIISTDISKTDGSSLNNNQDTTKYIFYAPGYVSVLHPDDQHPNTSDTKQHNSQTLGNTNYLPVHVLSEQPLICNDNLSLKINQPMPFKNVTLVKKQDGNILNIGETSYMSPPNFLKRLHSPKEVAIQTNQENNKMHAFVADYLMSTMKLLNPILVTNGKSVSLSEYEKKTDIEAFVELAEKPSENQIVTQVIGMCCSCRSVANLIKQVMFAKQSVGKSKCPLCVERYATVVGVKQHLKKDHFPCSIMTGKKHLRVKIIDTEETLYVPKSKNLVLECFCCKTKFSEIKEFIKHIQLFHYQSIVNIILQSDDETSVYEEDYFITTDKHFENMKYRAIDKVVSVDTEMSVETSKNSNVKERDENTFHTDSAKARNSKCSQSVEGPSSIEQEIVTKSKNPASCSVSTEQFKSQNKKLKLADETKKSKEPHLCLKCFNTFETNSDLLKHIETHLADLSSKSDAKARELSSSSTTEKKDTSCSAENADKFEHDTSTIETESKLTEADSTVLINSAHACSNNSGNDVEKKNSTTMEAVSQKQVKTAPLMNVQSGIGIDQNYCSSTSNVNIDSVSDESIDSRNSMETVSSERTIAISGNTCTSCSKTFDSEKKLNEHMYFIHDITLEGTIVTDILESNSSETKENPAKEVKDENKDKTIKQENASTRESKIPVIRRVWRCYQCSESFYIKEDLSIHRYKKHNDNSGVHVCENCNTVLMSHSKVNMHLCSDVDTWKCRRCNLDFSDSSSLRSHNIQKHLEKEGSKKCRLCGKVFLTMSMLDRHISFFHKAFKDDIRRLSEKKRSLSTSELNNTAPLRCSTPNKPSTSTGLDGSQNDDAKAQDNSAYSTATIPVSFDAKKPVAWQCDEEDSAYKLFDGDVYMCGVCQRETNSKPGLKLHLKKQHKIWAEECQLCSNLFEKDCIGNHLIRDHVIPKYSREEDMKVHDYNEESFLKLLSPERLLTCCQYQKYVDQSYNGTESMTCPRCSKNFLNGRFHRIHFLWMHDTTCLLCNEDFDKPATAVGHKIRVHNSIGTYMWAIEKILKTLLDLNIFGETIEDMINKLENKEVFFGKGRSKKRTKRTIGRNNATTEGTRESTTSMEGKEYCVLLPTNGNDVDQLSEEITAQDSALDDTEDDERRLVLVITQSDIEMHKNDIKTLAKKLCEDNNIFSQDYIEKLLESYVKSKKI